MGTPVDPGRDAAAIDLVVLSACAQALPADEGTDGA
jgi:hypothetical protein